MILLKQFNIEPVYFENTTRHNKNKLVKKNVDVREEVTVESGSVFHYRTYYKNIKVPKDHFKLFKNTTIHFDNITILVGENGCGKSVLLKTLSNEPNTILLNFFHKSQILKMKQKSINAFQPQNFLTNSVDYWDTMDLSNGETILELLQDLYNITGKVILLDEPETSLSLKSLAKLISWIHHLSANNQIIIATHSQYLMGLTEKVYNVEKMNFIKSSTFIIKQLKILKKC